VSSSDAPSEETEPPVETTIRPAVADSGVDVGQIRAFLELTPLERLRKMQSFVGAVIRIRKLNAQ
jgi:hypothetical protein